MNRDFQISKVCRLVRPFTIPKLPVRRNEPYRVHCTRNEQSVVDMSEKVVVIGGGIGGLSTALALTKVNIPVMVLERSPALRKEGAAIGLLANAWKALEALDIAQDLRTFSVLCTNAEWRTSDGNLLRSLSLKEAKGRNEMRAVMRSKLLTYLAKDLPSDTIHFNHDLVSVKCVAKNETILKFQNGKELKCRVVVGADGSRSRIASTLDLPLPEFAGYSAIRGISRLEGSGLAKATIVYYLGTGTRFGAYQVENDKIYWFITFNTSKCSSELFHQDYSMPDEKMMMEKAKELSRQYNSCVQACIENCIPGLIIFSKISDRLMSPFETPGKGLVTICGDAFHPMTPNLGQGGGLALEDSVVLARSLSSVGGLGASDECLENVLRSYEQQRLKRVSAVTIRSRVFGALLQIPFRPVISAAEFILSNVVNPGNVYLSTAQYDCGSLSIT